MNQRRLSPEDEAARRAAVPPIDYPPELPVSARRDEIARAIREHQVVIVCGETGSGKTTQLPKICLEAGRGIHGLVGHTQPRRLAARATAARIAQELKTELGDAVGFKIRFTDRTSPRSFVKLMTDGILLAETQTDRYLRQYDTLIIDEAHERSLNIDFLLGYLRQLLPRRPDLKLVVTSATLDVERFAKHFAGAPVIEVSGRMYPVEVRWRPLHAVEDDEEDLDLDEGIADAVDELWRHGPGDILVFLPGEREIRDATDALRKRVRPGAEILPLYSRLSAAEQDRVFRSSNGFRVVLSTNVAETSLTVPGVRYVIDSGLARVKRYSFRNKVEQLQVEKIAQAAAKQRAGRCGRVANGICIRLYDEEDFGKRPAFTEPEILRSSLGAVILRMKALGLTEIDRFPFIEPPTPKAIADGYALLQELGAVDDERRLTKVGREIARLPVDPRVARMILAAKHEGSLAEVLVIAAALSVQDPRERPADRQQAADEAQKKFNDERSDFVAFLKLWLAMEVAMGGGRDRADGAGEGKGTSRTAGLKRLCRDHYLSFLRMREWRDIHVQLKDIAGELGWKAGDPQWDGKLYAPIHKALLAGLLGNVGLKSEDGHYLGARGIKFFVHPSSGLTKKPPRWAVAEELIETTRLYARCLGAIEPEWIEQIGGHLLKRSRSEPHWEKKQAQVVALERGTLYGIPVYQNRRVSYGNIDPVESRRVFIRAALVEGDYETKAPFFQHNRRLVREIEQLEHKSRRPDVLVDDELIFAFYDGLLPESVTSGQQFDHWRAKAESGNPKLLFLKREELMRHEAAGVTTAQFPPSIELAGRTLSLDYMHDPGGARDGVTMTVPLVALNQLPAGRCEWLVPGLVREKVQALAKSLPQKVRHQLGPLAEFATEFTENVPPADVPLAEAITRYARQSRNLVLPADGFRRETLSAHLFMNFRVVDEHGRQLGMGRNLAQLRQELGGEAAKQFSAIAAPVVEGERHTTWAFGDLDEVMELRHGSQTLVGYPGLVDRGEAVSLEVFDSAEKARDAHRGGLLRLLLLALREQAKYVEKNLPGLQQMTLQFATFGDGAELRRQLLAATFERACMAEPLPMSKAAFDARVVEGKGRIPLIGQEIARLVGGILAEYHAVLKKLQGFKASPEPVKDMQAQLARLVHGRFIADTPFERLTQYPRYLKAASLRLDKLRADPARDARNLAELGPLESAWLRELASQRKGGGTPDPQLDQFRWLLEELRVQLFAQELRTPVPVSSKRLSKMWQTIGR
jgi:ATP-dependent helicase HrpA